MFRNVCLFSLARVTIVIIERPYGEFSQFDCCEKKAEEGQKCPRKTRERKQREEGLPSN
jgi:hypothetical protein